MGNEGRTSSGDPRATIASCAICGAPCVLDGDEAQRRVRCTQCGETYALVLARVAREGWTVIDPAGNVASFDDSESVRKSLPPGRLVLEPQSDPHMGKDGRVDTPIQGTAAPERTDRSSKPPTLRPPAEAAWPARHPPSSTELVAEELVESLPSEVSIKSASDHADKPADSGNPVSFEDVLEMMPAPQVQPRPSKAPPLPSKAPKAAITIPVGSPSTDTQEEEEEARPPVVVAPPPRPPAGLKKPVTVEQAEPDYARDEEDEPRKPASVRQTLDDEPPGNGRGWMIAVAIVAVLGIVFFAYSRADSTPPKPAATAPPTASSAVANAMAPPPASVSAASVGAVPSASASVVASASASAVPSAAPSASIAAVSGAASGGGGGGGGGGEPAPSSGGADNPNQPIADVLHAAHAAIRRGDAAGAQRQFERVLGRDPNNVEAIAGLGDIARAAGDMAKAKESYEAALAKAPHYVPAQLALADIKWDTGEKSDAIARYAAIVEKLGNAAPARAKERANPN